MTVSISNVLSAFKITSGSTDLKNNSITITYIKNSNDIPDDIPFTISNTAKDFYIKVSPVTSFMPMQVYLVSGSSPINSENPVILQPTSSRDLVVRLVSTLEQYPDEKLQENVKFNLVAMIVDQPIRTSSTTTSTTSGGGGGGGGVTPTQTDTGTDQETITPQL